MNQYKTPYEIRLACRENREEQFPSRLLSGYLCVNLVMVDKAYADEFHTFCKLNPKPCPVLAVLPEGIRHCEEFGKDIDVCIDLAYYDIYRDGVLDSTVRDVTDLYTDSTVSFLVGSSVSFDLLFKDQGLGASYGPVLYLTNVDCTPHGRFKGKMVVTMRSFDPSVTDQVADYTSHLPRCHGGPIGRNNPEELGIDLKHPMGPLQGKPPEGHDLLFWACGVTPSIVAQEAKLPLMIVHTSGYAMITDVPTESLYE